MPLCEHFGYTNVDCGYNAGRKICYPCGMPACGACSFLMYRFKDGKRVRVGLNCIEDHPGEYALMKPMIRELQIGEEYLKKHGHNNASFARLLHHYGFSVGYISGGIYHGDLKSNAPKKAIERILSI